MPKLKIKLSQREELKSLIFKLEWDLKKLRKFFNEKYKKVDLKQKKRRTSKGNGA